MLPFLLISLNACSTSQTGNYLYPDPSTLTTDALCYKLETAHLAPLHIRSEWAAECRMRQLCYCLN